MIILGQYEIGGHFISPHLCASSIKTVEICGLSVGQISRWLFDISSGTVYEFYLELVCTTLGLPILSMKLHKMLQSNIPRFSFELFCLLTPAVFHLQPIVQSMYGMLNTNLVTNLGHMGNPPV